MREDLVPIGEPGCEQQLVPKRKPTPFHAPKPYSDLNAGCAGETAAWAPRPYDNRGRKPPRHWVTY